MRPRILQMKVVFKNSSIIIIRKPCCFDSFKNPNRCYEKKHILWSMSTQDRTWKCVIRKSEAQKGNSWSGSLFFSRKGKPGWSCFCGVRNKTRFRYDNRPAWQMMKITQKRGVAKMRAYVRHDNQGMLHIFRNHDFINRPSDSPEEVILWRILESCNQNHKTIFVEVWVFQILFIFQLES